MTSVGFNFLRGCPRVADPFPIHIRPPEPDPPPPLCGHHKWMAPLYENCILQPPFSKDAGRKKLSIMKLK